MFFKKKSKKETPILPSQEYNNVIQFTKNAIAQKANIAEKIDIIDYILSTVKADLQTDLLSAILYSGWDLKYINDPFPPYYYDEDGNTLCISLDENETKKVDLEGNCVLVLPWNAQRYVSALLNIKQHPFEYDTCNHFSTYYEYINLCYVYNGIHSSSAGVTYKKGYIISKVYHTELLFTHVYTDGEHWYNIHTNQSIDKVWDFRTAIIYELCRLKYDLEKL